MSVTQMRSARMNDAEWQTRVDLAACYRLQHVAMLDAEAARKAQGFATEY